MQVMLALLQLNQNASATYILIMPRDNSSQERRLINAALELLSSKESPKHNSADCRIRHGSMKLTLISDSSGQQAGIALGGY
jgi:hypothetical protein